LIPSKAGYDEGDDSYPVHRVFYFTYTKHIFYTVVKKKLHPPSEPSTFSLSGRHLQWSRRRIVPLVAFDNGIACVDNHQRGIGIVPAS
jgi:hypothetical protein